MNGRLLLLAVAAALLASASSVGASTETSMRKNGPLTIFSDRLPVASIDTVGYGLSSTIWRCPHDIWCGEEVSMAWAPDGRRLALTLDEIGGLSGYAPGLHVIDVVSGRDIRIPSGAPGTTVDRRFPSYLGKMMARVGCWPATDLAWAPDGSKLAYRCGDGGEGAFRGYHINVLEIHGSGYRTVPTPTAAFWPSWSPDGTRIAYSTGLTPRGHPSVFTVGLDGSHRRLVARDATAPSWSPDGKTIAYQTICGVRLVTPTGKDVLREGRCGLGNSGRPVWSPDGSKLAIEAGTGIYEMPADGSSHQVVSRRTSTSHYGQQPGRPSWRPLP